jgi:hypothetical protein
LSSQRVDLKDALYITREKDKGKAEAVNPLVENGQKLIPSVTRVFSRSRDLYIYLQAYEQGVAAAQPLVAFVSFYRGRAKVFETQPIQVRTGAANRLRTMPVVFSIPLAELASGSYDCQVTILNPEGQKSAFWRAPIVLVN